MTNVKPNECIVIFSKRNVMLVADFFFQSKHDYYYANIIAEMTLTIYTNIGRYANYDIIIIFYIKVFTWRFQKLWVVGQKIHTKEKKITIQTVVHNRKHRKIKIPVKAKRELSDSGMRSHSRCTKFWIVSLVIDWKGKWII